VSGESLRGREIRRKSYFRTTLVIASLGLWLLFLIPPLETWSRQYEFVQAIQFCLFAIVIPALLVAGGPWRLLVLASGEPLRFSSDGALVSPGPRKLFDRWALSRVGRRGHQRSVSLLLLFMGQTILWRSAPVVDLLGRHVWLVVIESITLVVGGVLLWFELVDSPPLSPSTTRPYRIGISAIAMWTVWVTAYLMAMTHSSWSPVFHHKAGLDLSPYVDQQFTAGVMWFIAAVAFIPLVFSNLNRWLRSEDDPDDELCQLVRRDRTRGFFGTNP